MLDASWLGASMMAWDRALKVTCYGGSNAKSEWEVIATGQLYIRGMKLSLSGMACYKREPSFPAVGA